MPESRNRILRRIILNICDSKSIVPEAVQIGDITDIWGFIWEVGIPPYDLLVKANSEDESLISDATLNRYLKALNRYWGTINTSKD